MLLKRGRLLINVHTTSGCLELDVVSSARVDNDAVQPGQSSVFGAGPVVSWGSANAPNVLKFYDLMGRHDRPKFQDSGWLSIRSGADSANALGAITWERTELPIEGVRAIQFSVSPRNQAPYVFGFAVDPDLGRNAADDASGIDTSRGLVYAIDSGRAFGILLLNQRGVGPAAVWQYGASCFSPSDPKRIWLAQRARGRHLISNPGDAQFILSSPGESGSGRYTVVLIEAADLYELRARADTARAALR